MASQVQQTVHTGNTILLKIAGKEIGRAQGIDGRRSFGTEGVYEIGSIMPAEHVHNRFDGTVSVDRFFVRRSSLDQLGLTSLGEEVLKKDLIDIEVLDKVTGKTVRVYRGCSLSECSENFRVGQISGENATFQYLDSSAGGDTSGGVNISVNGQINF